jgi:hypothetical protein
VINGNVTLNDASNIDIAYRNSMFFGIKFIHGNASNALFNSVYKLYDDTYVVPTVFDLSSNFSRQLGCVKLSNDGYATGYKTAGYYADNEGSIVCTRFPFGLIVNIGICNVNNEFQTFFGLSDSPNQIYLNDQNHLINIPNIICFGSYNDSNICIYTNKDRVASKQKDLGPSFPCNSELESNKNWFNLSLYWNGTSIYYKAINTTLNVTVRGSFIPDSDTFPSSDVKLYPHVFRIVNFPSFVGYHLLQLQTFGVF